MASEHVLVFRHVPYVIQIDTKLLHITEIHTNVVNDFVPYIYATNYITRNRVYIY